MVALSVLDSGMPPGGPDDGLDWLLGAISRADFLRDFWDCELLHVVRDDLGFYAPLATAAQVREIVGLAVSLSDATRTRPLVELVGGEKSAGNVRLRDATTTARTLWQAHARGSTILVQMAQRYWSPFARLCGALEAQLRAPLDATLICTPAGSQAFGRHFDRLNAIVVQLSGRKSWRLLGEAQPAPLQDLPLLPFETMEAGRDRLAGWAVSDRSLSEVGRSVTLEPGDMLYVPRGIYHDVWTEDEDSVHVTLAVRPVTYVDLMVAALGRYVEHNPKIRAGLVACGDGAAKQDTLSGLARDFAASVDARTAMTDMETAYFRAAPSEDLADRILIEPTPASTLVHVSAHRPTVVLARGVAEFYFGDRLFRLPERAAPALRFVAGNRHFEVAAIPGLTPNGAMTLVRRLVRANVLRVLEPYETSTLQMEAHDEHEPL